MQHHDYKSVVAHADRPSDDAQMFELAPVSLWVEDYSQVKALFADWRRAGVSKLGDFLREDPERVKACSARIHVVKVNQRTLTLFEANDLSHLVQNLARVFRDDMFHAHVDELVQLWEGQTQFFSHTVNYTLSGRRLDIQLKGTIVPGHEHDWGRVLVAIEDVTARESARRAIGIVRGRAEVVFMLC